MNKNIVILALGSNYGNRLLNLKTAIRMLPLSSQSYSYIYENKALIPEQSPDWWNIPFLNMAVSGYSNLSIKSMLFQIQKIEKYLGRNKKDHWAPRTIDIDIIFWKNLVLKTEKLTIPHSQMHVRNFVLIPTCDIAPNFVHPIFHLKAITLLKESKLQHLIKKYTLKKV